MRHTSFVPLYSVVVLMAAAALAGCPQTPKITLQPVSVTVALGDPATLTVAASGDEPLSYEWLKGGTSVGAGATYSVAAAAKTDEGTYTCKVSNGSGSITSDPATITVLVPALAVAPGDQPVGAGGGTATFNVSNGQAGTTLNWTAAVNGADTWLTIGAPASGTNAGAITATAAANNTTSQRVGHITVSSAGATGSPATVAVTQAAGVAPTITTQPVSQTVKAGDSVTFTVAATGTAPLSYVWKKGATAVSGATSASYTIASPQNTDEGSFTCVVTNAVGSATSNAATLTVLAKPVASIDVVGMNAEKLAAAGLTTTASSGLSNVGAGTHVYLEAEASDPDGDAVTYAWSLLSKPESSAAAFLDPNPVFDEKAVSSVVFLADVVGTYIVQLSVDDHTGSKGLTSVTKTINAGEWVGAGAVKKDGSGMVSGTSTCTGCHNPTNVPAPDKFTPWRQTLHATYFARAMDGQISSYYNASCIGCHTVGYDTTPTAVNNGFDDIATLLNWSLPSPLQAGNWDAMVTNYPELAKRGGIQCENCHGPASEHPDAAFSQDNIKMDASLSADVCGQCHHQNVQWETTGHADASSIVFTYPVGPGHSACVKCHSGLGYIDNAEGVPEANQNLGKQVHSCAVCHDPHDATNPKQLRVYDSVKLPGDAVARTGFGESATCMSCHNARVAKESALAASPGFSHHSTASEAMLGIGGFTFGLNVDLDSGHKLADLKCVDCHMAATPGNAHDAVHTPGEDEVGGHTFRLRFEKEGDPDNGFQNIANACVRCHEDMTDINLIGWGDYDGNGKTEGVQTEVKGLLDVLLAQIVANGVQHLPAYPYWTWGGVPTAKKTLLEQAVWNYELVRQEGSYGVHNTPWAVGLLQLTYKQLAGVDIPGAYIRY